ncbi:MAG TPA: FecR family protein, partial [Salinimicrobium sp.]|nr:FecR family protein [Salinimicrobium sp.]
PFFDSEKNYGSIQRKTKKKKDSSWKSLLKIAAIFAVIAVSYFAFFNDSQTSIQTLAANTETVVLPDHSVVELNAETSIKYSEENWDENRSIKLEGEAFFKVEKGSKFEVETSAGTVRVLGTQFNIKQRKDYFEVVCFEGLVEVETDEKTLKLSPGKMFRIHQSEIQTGHTFQPKPTWLNGKSSFESVAFEEVLAELERQYAVEVKITNPTINQEDHFTGSFVHNDLEAALKSISLPFGLEYTINGNEVILK